MNKFETLPRDERTGYMRIRALMDIPRHGVKAGDLGGRIGSKESLSMDGDCWIERGSEACGASRVAGDAIVRGGSVIDQGARIDGASVVESCVIEGYSYVKDSIVTESKLVSSKVRHSEVRRSNMKHSIAWYSEISGVVLDDTDIEGSPTNRAYIHIGDIASSRITGGADIRSTFLRRVTIMNGKVSGVTLSNVKLSHPDITTGYEIVVTEGLPSGPMLLYRTEGGYLFSIGCWEGTVEELRDILAKDSGWPSGNDKVIPVRRPILLGVADMADSIISSWSRDKSAR